MTDPLDEYNPECYDDDTIQKDEGWRCLVIMETMPGYILPDDLQLYDDTDEEWQDSCAAGSQWLAGYAGITFRTMADVPNRISPITGMPAQIPSDDPLAVILKMVKP